MTSKNISRILPYQSHLTAISLGSNQGDRLAMLRFGRDQLVARATLVSQSAVYETEPVGCPPGSASFLNVVIVLEWAASPESLLWLTQSIETEAGRLPKSERAVNAPRPLDLDILLMGDVVRDSLDLTLPHPRWHLRRFVLMPLAELLPNYVVPGQDQSVQALLEQFSDTDEPEPRYYCEQW